MSKGMRTRLTDEAHATLATDYRAGLGINALRAKYAIGQARVIALLEALASCRDKYGCHVQVGP